MAWTSFGPINSASNFSCCQNVRIISGDGGEDFRAKSSAGSRCEKLKIKIKTQTAASPAQIRRHGKINSRQINIGRVAVSATLNLGTAARRPSQTTLRRIASSFGAAA